MGQASHPQSRWAYPHHAPRRRRGRGGQRKGLGGGRLFRRFERPDTDPGLDRNHRAQQPSPTPVGNAFLQGAATTGADNAWAVGDSDFNGTQASLILHWDGTAWTQVPSPNPSSMDFLTAVAASSASNAWAVGQFTDDNTAINQNMAIHCC